MVLFSEGWFYRLKLGEPWFFFAPFNNKEYGNGSKRIGN
jgi:hypothetical protein